MCVWNLEQHEELPSELSQYFERKILIGTSRDPAVVRPCKRKRSINGKIAYHTFWDKIRQTFLLTKGIDRFAVEKMAYTFRNKVFFELGSGEPETSRTADSLIKKYGLDPWKSTKL